MTIATFQVTGAAFRQSSGPKAPFTIAPGETTAFVIDFTPSAAGLYSGVLAIETRTFALSGTAFDSPLPKEELVKLTAALNQRSGDEVRGTVTATILAGWHINSAHPLESFAIPTTAINSPNIASVIPCFRAPAVCDAMQYPH